MKFKRIIASVVLAVFAATSTGCFGSFTLTQGIYNFNKDISSNGIVQWLVFLVMAGVLPVYQLGMLVDVIILNTIEFWTGTNPLAANGETPEKTVALENGGTLHMKRLSPTTMQITLERGDESITRTIQVQDDGVDVRDGSGELVGMLTDDASGATVVGPDGDLLYSTSEADQAVARKAYEEGGVSAMLRALTAPRATVAGR